ncbi:large ribosomal subunit protein uL15m-like [Babylonia areolata]|uniref:large ribosomal subunit protein uL15m-like n=1 Tax=Babylonia areolata TaxID=304850 RepID=UPI003FD00ECE
MAASGTRESALRLIRSLPRVGLNNIKSIQPKLRKERRRSFAKGKTHGRGHKGQGQHMTLPRLGFEGGNTPFYLIVPKEPYYQNHHLRRQYPPLSLLQLQRFIDLGRVDPSRPIDLTQLCNTGLYEVRVDQKHFGVHLTEEGVDIFAAKVNLEVQWTSELVIAAVERNGGTITTRYFDPRSLHAVVSPLTFFARSTAIPRCRLPPEDAMAFYSSAATRGYLAGEEEVDAERQKLAQKYGYVLPDLASDPAGPMLRMRKDPGQLFYGLQPGWVVNLKDKVVLKPTSPEHLELYSV